LILLVPSGLSFLLQACAEGWLWIRLLFSLLLVPLQAPLELQVLVGRSFLEETFRIHEVNLLFNKACIIHGNSDFGLGPQRRWFELGSVCGLLSEAL